VDRHWKAIQFCSIFAIAAFILALVNGWYLAAYGLIVGCGLGVFLFAVYVARVDNRPSYEDEETKEKQVAKKIGREMES
jgi:hypothetical protein